jgi:hypothetical protein
MNNRPFTEADMARINLNLQATALWRGWNMDGTPPAILEDDDMAKIHEKLQCEDHHWPGERLRKIVEHWSLLQYQNSISVSWKKFMTFLILVWACYFSMKSCNNLCLYSDFTGSLIAESITLALIYRVKPWYQFLIILFIELVFGISVDLSAFVFVIVALLENHKYLEHGLWLLAKILTVIVGLALFVFKMSTNTDLFSMLMNAYECKLLNCDQL